MLNVTSPDAAGTYAPGDVVTVWITFDYHVMVVGEPVLLLNTGNEEPGRASYAGGSGNQASVGQKERKTILVGDVGVFVILP